jgi:hypothetical protein
MAMATIPIAAFLAPGLNLIDRVPPRVAALPRLDPSVDASRIPTTVVPLRAVGGSAG